MCTRAHACVCFEENFWCHPQECRSFIIFDTRISNYLWTHQLGKTDRPASPEILLSPSPQHWNACVTRCLARLYGACQARTLDSPALSIILNLLYWLLFVFLSNHFHASGLSLLKPPFLLALISIICLFYLHTWIKSHLTWGRFYPLRVERPQWIHVVIHRDLWRHS